MVMEQTDLERTRAGAWRVIDIISGYRQALVLLAARRLGVFIELDRRPGSDRELAEALGLNREALRDVLHVLVELELVTRDGNGTYALTRSAHCLLADRPGSVGGALDLMEAEVHPAWGGLIHSLRTGSAAPRASHDDSPYSPMYQSEPVQEAFLDAMDLFASHLADQLAARDWSTFRTVLDVGGARGHLAMVLVRAHPHLRATVFDLPELEPAFTKYTAGLEITESLGFQAGDFFRDPLPRADAIILGHVLHNWPLDTRRALIRSAFEAANPGGALLIYDSMLDEDQPRMGNALVSLDMLVWSGGSEYLADDCMAWLAEAGFRDMERHSYGTGSTLVVGYKPAD